MIDTMGMAPTECLDACPLCGGTSARTLPVPGRWIGAEVFGDLRGKIGLVACRGCGLVFTNPRPSGGRLTAFYSGDTYCCHEATGSASAGARADLVLGRIAKHLPAGTPRTLLDYGAGGGGFLSHARDRGWAARGFEPGRRGLESCRRAGLDATDRLDGLPAGEFGLVTLHHVFEHLANPVEVLDGIGRLLSGEGRIYIEVPNARSLRARLAVPFLSRGFGVDERYRAYPIHLAYYSGRTLRALLAKAGWTVEATFTVGLGLNEFLVGPEASRGRAAGPAGATGGVASRPKRRLRHALRDAFLGLGMGENLAVIARPDRERRPAARSGPQAISRIAA